MKKLLTVLIMLALTSVLFADISGSVDSESTYDIDAETLKEVVDTPKVAHEGRTLFREDRHGERKRESALTAGNTVDPFVRFGCGHREPRSDANQGRPPVVARILGL